MSPKDLAKADGATTIKPLISLRGIGRGFAAGDEVVTVLRDVDLDIFPGEMIAIIGASGSGKSTLMNILGCLDSPSTGSYHFAGRDVATLGPDQQAELRREYFGFIFQRYQLLGDLDAVGNVEVPAIYAGAPREARRARARELLGQLGLASRLDHRPSELSGGQQQRVSVARALMNGGEVILADEPTGALDTKSSAELIELLKELNARGHAIIMVTHDPAVAAHAHRVIEISDGRILSDRRKDETPKPPPEASPVLPRSNNRSRQLWEATSMAVQAMVAHRMRSFLTMLGIIIGIASVVLVVALGTGSQEKVLENISSLGTNTITVRAGAGFGARGAGRIRTLIPTDADAIATQDYAEGVSPAVTANATARYGATEASVSINGVGDDYFGVRGFATTAGGLFDREDIRDLTQVVVISQEAKASFFADGTDPIGQVLHLGRVPVRVIGVVDSSGASFGPSSLNIYMPYTTVMSRVSGQKHLTSIEVRVKDGHDMTTAQDRIRSLLLGRHGVEDFFLQNSDTIRETITSTSRTMTLLIGAIAVISLVVGGIGVMNIMLVSVTERTREIGIRISVGARRSDIVAQFLIEAVLVCLTGGALGILTAVVTGYAVTLIASDIRLTFSTVSFVIAALSSTVIGVAFGIIPARKAAALNPTTAINAE